MQIQTPPTEGSTLGDDDSVRSALGHGDVGGDRVGIVLDVQDAVLGEASHSFEQQLSSTADQGGASGEVGVEPFDPPVVEGEHLVLGGLEQELALQVGELLWVVRREVVSLRPVVGAVPPNGRRRSEAAVCPDPTGLSGG